MKYLRDKHIVDMLKFRASYGEIGDDNIGDPFDSTRRWLYMSQEYYGSRPYREHLYMVSTEHSWK